MYRKRAIFLYACESWTLTAQLQRRMVVVLVVAFSWRARIWGECPTIHTPPAPFVFFPLFFVEISSR